MHQFLVKLLLLYTVGSELGLLAHVVLGAQGFDCPLQHCILRS